MMLTAIRIHKDMQEMDADLQKLSGKMDTVLQRSKTLRIPSEAIFCSGSVLKYRYIPRDTASEETEKLN